ncbi:MAG: hypothetical protein QXP98_02605 [Thermoproteus sp.]
MVYKVTSKNITTAIGQFSECVGDECIGYAEEFVKSLSADVSDIANKLSVEEASREALLDIGRSLYKLFRAAVDAGLVVGDLPKYIDRLDPDGAKDPRRESHRSAVPHASPLQECGVYGIR